MGEIEFERVTISYDPTKDPVLIDVNAHFPAKTRIGVVGRTGMSLDKSLCSNLR